MLNNKAKYKHEGKYYVRHPPKNKRTVFYRPIIQSVDKSWNGECFTTLIGDALAFGRHETYPSER